MASSGTVSSGPQLSEDDLTLLAKSFRDENFLQLLCDYAKEVSDPKNKKQFEEEVIKYEKEKGVEAAFLHPIPGFALRVTGQGGGSDLSFINICSSDVVQKPKLEPVNDGTGCHKWSLPHAVTKPRWEVVKPSGPSEVVSGQSGSNQHPQLTHQEQVNGCGLNQSSFERSYHEPTEEVKDKIGSREQPQVTRQAVVCDVVFHPEVFVLVRQTPVLKQTLIKTALHSLAEHFGVKEDKVEIEEVVDEYIGFPAEAIIRWQMKNFENQQTANSSELITPSEKSNPHKDYRTSSENTKTVNNNQKNMKTVRNESIEPVYKLKYIKKMDLQDYSFMPQSRPAYQALEVEVSLPGIRRASQVTANVYERSVDLETDSDPKYKLDLSLRLPVDEDSSIAKFDVATQKLTLTLNVISRQQKVAHGQSPPSDSGIECELDFRTNDSDSVSEGSVSSQDDNVKVTGEDDSVFEPKYYEGDKRVELKITPTPDSNTKTEPNGNTNGKGEDDDVFMPLQNENVDRDENVELGMGQADSSNQRKDKSLVSFSTNAKKIQDENRKGNERVSNTKQDELIMVPTYSLHQTREKLFVSLNCGNVIPGSIKTQHDETNAQIELSSIGGGHTTMHYSLRVNVMPNTIAASGLSYKDEKGKVILEVLKGGAGQWESCKVGRGDALTSIDLTPVPDDDLKETKDEKQDGSKSCVCVPRPPRMSRTASMCETEAGYPFRLRGPTCSWPRGILKHRTRSLSESQVSAFSTSVALESISSSLDIAVLEDKKYDDEEEEESVEESIASSLGEKKSVRFNEVVSRQLFRSNSSILGQRAKNQRKAIRKRKSQARKDSESEKSDTGITASESPSGESDLTTDAATDDDTDANTVVGEENAVDKEAKDIQNNNTRNSSKDKAADSDDICHLITNKNSPDVVLLNNNISKEEEEDNADFIIKTSKKKKRKNRKNKMSCFEPTNNLIFQLDMDK